MIGIFVSQVLMIVTLLYLIFSLAKMNIEKSDRHKIFYQTQLKCFFDTIKKLPNADTIIMDVHERHLTLLEKHNEKST